MKADKLAVERQRVKNLERALRVERTGLMALAMAFVREHGDAEALQRRIDAMARSAARNPKTPEALRDAFVSGQALVEQALRVELGKPQRLFDPHVGHVDPGEVERLGATGPDQLTLESPGELHSERNGWRERVDTGLLRALERGPASDLELHAAYLALQAYPWVSPATLRGRRVELTRLGRIVDSGERANDTPIWTLVERKAPA
jgi:hypothetical protein